LQEQLCERGIDISSGQEVFHAEKVGLLKAGLAASFYATVDNSGARHQGLCDD